MIFIVHPDKTVTTIGENVNVGDTASDLIVVSPFSGIQSCKISYTLPNGKEGPPIFATYTKEAQLGEQLDGHVYTMKLPPDMTRVPGVVKISILFTDSKARTFSSNDTTFSVGGFVSLPFPDTEDQGSDFGAQLQAQKVAIENLINEADAIVGNAAASAGAASSSATAAKTSEENAAASEKNAANSATAAGASAAAAKTSEENAAASEAKLAAHYNDPDAHSNLLESVKDYVDNEIATFDFIKVLDALPDEGLPNKIYLVPKKDTDTQDLYDEYLWIDGRWEFITTKKVEVDLTSHNESSYAHQNLFNRDTLASLIGKANATRDGLMPSKHHSLISTVIDILGEDDAYQFARELKAITDAVEVNEDGTVCVGGRANAADTKRSVIAGGHLNEIDAINGFIGAGKLNRAKGNGVFASGYRNELYASIGAAIGVDIEIGDIDADAQVNRTFGIGAHLKSNTDYQFLLGVGNVEDEGAAVIIGGGEVDKGHNLLSRKNIYTLRRSGVPEKGTDLVTKAFVEDLILGGEW